MQSYEELELWPAGPPSQNSLSGPETTIEPGYLGNVSVARLYLYPAAQPNGQAVLLCPGGGFYGVSVQHEGHSFAPWFNERGITLAVLKYRLPNGRLQIPLDDVHQAMCMLRQRADTLLIRNLGVMGASAGGYLAASLAVFPEADTRPDFQILLYPMISLKDELVHRISRRNLMGRRPSAGDIADLTPEEHVTGQTPPAFLVTAGDDLTVSPENSLVYYRALRQQRIPVSLHIYPNGGHSFALRDTFRYKAQWTAELERWLEFVRP